MQPLQASWQAHWCHWRCSSNITADDEDDDDDDDDDDDGDDGHARCRSCVNSPRSSEG